MGYSWLKRSTSVLLPFLPSLAELIEEITTPGLNAIYWERQNKLWVDNSGRETLHSVSYITAAKLEVN